MVKTNKDLALLKRNFNSGIKSKSKVIRRVLSVEEKMKVIEELKKGKSYRAIADIFGVGKTQINSICHERELIEKCVAEKLVQPQAKRLLSRAAYPEIDNAVFKWFEFMRNPCLKLKSHPLSGKHIQEIAIAVAKQKAVSVRRGPLRYSWNKRSQIKTKVNSSSVYKCYWHRKDRSTYRRNCQATYVLSRWQQVSDSVPGPKACLG